MHGLIKTNNHRCDTQLKSSSSPDPNPLGVGGGEQNEIRVNWAVRKYNAYIRMLDKKPLITQIMTVGLITATGDILSQCLEARVAGTSLILNWARLSAFAISGAFFVGPYVHTWYGVLWKLGRWQEQKYGLSRSWQVMTQTIVDQTVGVAVFFPVYFYVFEAVEAALGLRVPNFSYATEKIRTELLSLLVTQYKVWPLTNIINFAFVPKNLRVLVSSIVSVFWNAYLCTRIA